jgi:hypothetical protein
MSPTFSDLSSFFDHRRFVSIAHHSPGRIRLRLDAAALKRLSNVDPTPFADLLQRIHGVKLIRINAAVLSIIIDYDVAQIPETAWGRLLVADKAEVETILTRHIS